MGGACRRSVFFWDDDNGDDVDRGAVIRAEPAAGRLRRLRQKRPGALSFLSFPSGPYSLLSHVQRVRTRDGRGGREEGEEATKKQAKIPCALAVIGQQHPRRLFPRDEETKQGEELCRVCGECGWVSVLMG